MITAPTVTVRTSSPVLVGRAEELRALRELVPRPGSVTFVEGEAGVGKTRLVGEALAGPELAGWCRLVGYCQPLREPFPYGAVLEALRGVDEHRINAAGLTAVAGSLRPYLPELAYLLPEQPVPLGDAGAERHRLFRAVRELLGALGPAVLVVEDVHWADDGSRQLLRFLTADPPGTLGTVLTYRPEDSPGGIPLGGAFRPSPARPGAFGQGADPVSATIRLRPLDVAGVRGMAAAILGDAAVTAELAGLLHERTAGIPFVVEEALRALRDPGGGVHRDVTAVRRLLEPAEVPVLLREAMLERLARLPLPARRITEAAAVLGVPAGSALLGTVAALPAERARTALTRAVHANVLVEVADARYGFRHTLAQQAVYRTLPGPERERLHRRALAALRAVEPAPLVQLAEHSRRAGLSGDWLRYAEAAADRAIGVGDAAIAIASLREPLAEPTLAPSDVDRLAGKLTRIAANGLGQHEVADTLERLLADRRLGDTVRGEVRLTLGLLLIRQAGGLEAGRAEIERAVRDLADRPDLRAKGMSVLAQPFVGSTPLSQLLPWMAEVDAAIATAGEDLVATNLLANNLAAWVHIGDPRGWRMVPRLPVRVRDREEQRYLARAHCNLADACAWIGHYDRAYGFLRSGMRLAVDSGAPFVASTARSTQAHLDWLTGTWDGLGERAARLLDEYRDLHPVASELSFVLGALAVARGEWHRAAEHFAHTGVADPDNAVTPVVLATHAATARMLVDQEDYPAAAAECDAGLDRLRHKEIWAWAGELAPAAVDAYCRAGREADAVALVEELAAGVADRDAPAADAALLLCRGMVAAHRREHAVAEPLLDRARAAYAELPARYFAALAAERLARCRVNADDASAATLLTTVAATFDTLGATRDAARCRHLLRLHGAGPRSRRGRRGYGNELSPREFDVARLVAAGRTNREIAEVLFLSRRTVEQHVARVLRKLGLGSRGELRGDTLSRMAPR
ncbi:regulatory protein, luxR family [Amycolatopsis arida]|uniref:Regulatory protein, luxR family n=1 Tax=Amycolatopsis arida TaxID=587909 RepID=A0A1I6ASH0_9PSEU|nr:LuxR family transcriptional regulator [Amycolatopsis arida]TDX97556.1 regulatory LuxR family protein [Amycolatopsis arida]SFQ71592.1 regulatory protein, luxR family [Amycolatopsis arida]